MLANNFLSAEALGLSEAQVSALQKTLVLMETGKITHAESRYRSDNNPKFSGLFNMDNWQAHSYCGTVACIGGTAELVGNVCFHWDETPPLRRLFFPSFESGVEEFDDYTNITVEQAALALRNYLTMGEPFWAEVLA